MKNLIFLPLLFLCSCIIGQPPVKYSVLIGSDYIQVGPDGTLDTVTTLNIIPPKEYEAILTQSSTDAPSAIVLKNTLGGDVDWNYTTTGTYVGTLEADLLTANKTVCEAHYQDALGANPRIYNLSRASGSSMVLTSRSSSLTLSDPATDNVIHVLIKVYY